MFAEFTNIVTRQNSLQDWLVAFAFLAGSIIVSRVFYLIISKGLKKLFEKARGKLLYIVTDMLEEPIAMLIVIFGFYYAQRRLHFPENIDAGTDKVIVFAIILVITWALARLVDDLLSQYLVPLIEKSDSKLDDQLLPVIRKSLKILIWAIGIIVALDNVGYNVGTIIAGLGIGGLAFAFAAQETIANLFGGITVFVDAPFRIDDRIKIGGYEGWIREIGLRTSRVETLDGRRLTLPNSFFSKSVIENVSSEPATKVTQILGLACTLKAAQLASAVDVLKAVLAADPDLEANSTAFFKDFGDAAYNFAAVLWIKKGADYVGTLSRVNLAMVKALEENGIDLAVPVRFMYTPTKN